MLKRFFALLAALAILAGCQPRQQPAPPTILPAIPTASPVPPGQEWWREAVFYEIFVRSFYDSNGDGIGDLKGITEKLDYLNDGKPGTGDDLGVTGIWLMPIFPSPSYHGYDVIDFYSVNPQYGTIDDFKTLLQEAHKRGIRVIIDLVLNHTSDKNAWFKSAKADVNSPYRDWYIWSDTEPKYKGPWGEKVWHPSLTGYYYGIFEAFMPDLNYTNPAVTQEMEKVVAFWLEDVGVDGFRLDAAKHLIEEGPNQQNTAATHAWFAAFRPVYKADNPESVTVGEISGDPPPTIAGYTRGDQLDLAFNFPLASAFLKAADSGDASYAVSALQTSAQALPTANYAPFLTNHDQDRVMNRLGGDVDKAKVAASLLLTSPGTPFIYYGEEIGMQGKKPDENIRRPMQWSADANAGFTAGRPWRVPDAAFSTVNVSAETGDPASLLSHYRALIALHDSHPALASPHIWLPDTGAPSVYAALRVQNDDMILVLVNLGAELATEYSLTLAKSDLPEGKYALSPLMGDSNAAELTVTGGGAIAGYTPFTELAPHSTYIFEISLDPQ